MHEVSRYALVGPGAIGLYYGGLLAKAGFGLQVLGRSDYEALCTNGITIRMIDPVSGNLLESFTVEPEGVKKEAASIGRVDCVIIAAKATANKDLIPYLQPLVEPKRTILLTLQNGMGNVEFLARHFPENPILAGLCFVCVNRKAAGVVNNYLPGRVEIGSMNDRWPDSATQLVAVFTEASVKCKVAPELNAAIWRKLCWNVPFNGLAIAAGGLTTDLILADDKLARRAHCLMVELQSAAALQGYVISDEFLRGQFEATEKMGAYQPSSLIDYQEGRAVEVEAIFGEPFRRGQARGLEMPELGRLYAEINKLLARS